MTRAASVPFDGFSLFLETGVYQDEIRVRAGNVYTPTMIGRASWKALISGSSLQINCNREGFNSNPMNAARTRIGIVANQENNCSSPDSYIGIGNAAAPCGPAPERAVGNVAACMADNGDKNLPAFGVVFVR